uniref:ribonuclease P protein component n=1 Tax=Candidatus Planktophila sp. TaxID=2175601 RepID=UPI00404A581F
MLAKTARLTESGDFARATKSGLRYSTANFVGYLYPTGVSQPARAGLIINKTIGGSVTRHRIARQVRHVLQESYSQLPEGSLVVVRALKNSKKIQNQKTEQQDSQELHSIDVAGEVKKIITQLLKKLHEKANQK